MSWLQHLGSVRDYLPLLVAVVVTACALGLTRGLLLLRERRHAAPALGGLGGQLAMLAVTALGVVLVVLALPTSDTLKGQLLGLLGIALTGAVAFSSTTFVANAMAGLMLRAMSNFRAGDWVKVGDQFGRVTERGLFHTEIQTEDRDLATLPNLYLVTNPVKVVRTSGTIVSTSLSLGYDCDHAEIEGLLVEAGRQSGLEEPFVHILELGDFSVTYRVAGFLADVKHLLSAGSRLRAGVLDVLHGAGVEIVSPTFMNQRRLGDDARVVPARRAGAAAEPESPAPEAIIFDKADHEASLEDLRAERERLGAEIEALRESAGAAKDAERARIESEIARRRAQMDELGARLEREASREQEPK
ncbi:MAG TPA: mechanosensitive ion channel domain-containing protein [Myxococcota bacterium]